MNVPGTDDDAQAEPGGVSKQRLDEIFGDVLPESTRDDLDQRSGATAYQDSWFTENRPPHHGG